MNTSIARVLTGLGILGIGLLALLDALGVLKFGNVAGDWWPLVIIYAGVVMFISNPRNYVWALIVAAFGGALLARELGYTDVNIFKLFWPVVLLVVGASILLNRTGAKLDISDKEREDSFAFLGGVNTKNTAEEYRGGKATAVLGGVSLDLSGAKINKEATLQVTAFWGGVEIKVPEGWVVKSRVHAIMGGVENKANATKSKDAPVLIIVGDVIMAGVEIKHQ